eukprot:scaffold214_cov249-Pinguiococcus_pyrenoidosus.AAC.38
MAPHRLHVLPAADHAVLHGIGDLESASVLEKSLSEKSALGVGARRLQRAAGHVSQVLRAPNRARKHCARAVRACEASFHQAGAIVDDDGLVGHEIHRRAAFRTESGKKRGKTGFRAARHQSKVWIFVKPPRDTDGCWRTAEVNATRLIRAGTLRDTATWKRCDAVSLTNNLLQPNH